MNEYTPLRAIHPSLNGSVVMRLALSEPYKVSAGGYDSFSGTPDTVPVIVSGGTSSAVAGTAGARKRTAAATTPSVRGRFFRILWWALCMGSIRLDEGALHVPSEPFVSQAEAEKSPG
ncbi:hypothetical protein GCM10007967_19010 [Xylanimonas ulmi]